MNRIDLVARTLVRSGINGRPSNRRFKPGHSGNPKGRPKGRKNFKTMFIEVLNKKVKLRDKNRTRRVSKLEAMIEVVANKALAGDAHAFVRIVQIAEKIEAFTWQPEPTVDLSGFELLERRLDELAARGELSQKTTDQWRDYRAAVAAHNNCQNSSPSE